MTSRIHIFLFLLFGYFGAFSQKVGLFPGEHPQKEMYFTHITRENGLPSRIVNYFIQDFQGYIWIGTADGLARFDGHDIKIFRSVPGDRSSLVDNMIYTLKEMSDSTIWIGTADGISVYDPKTGRFRSYSRDTPGLTCFSGRSVRCFFEDKDQTVWIGTDNNLVRTTLSHAKFDLIQLQRSENPLDREFNFRNIGCIKEDPRDHEKFLMATAGGLILFDKKTGTVTRDYKHLVNKVTCLTDIYFDGKGGLWTCGWGMGLLRMDLKKETWKDYPFQNLPVTIFSITSMNREEVLLATADYGLGVFNMNTKSFRFYGKNTSVLNTISDKSISCISWFNQGKDLWIGSREGINIENRQFYTFRRILLPYKHEWISDYFHDRRNNKLYVAGYGSDGLFCWDKMLHKWNIIKENYHQANKPLSITNLYQDSKGVLWVSTRRNLLYLDKEKNCLRPFVTKDGSVLKIKDPVVYAVKEDAEGNLWIGSRFDGVIRLDAARKEATYYKNDPMDPFSLSDGTHFGAIAIDRFNQIWFGNSKGVSIFDPEQHHFLNFMMDSIRHYGIKKRWVNTIEPDSMGRMWLGFDEEGLVRVEEQKKGHFSYKIFTTGNGLNVPGIDWISQDPGGTFWIVNKGLLHLNPYTENFQFYDERNGLHSNPEGASKVYVDESGNIFMDSEGGFDMVNIDELGVSDTVSINLLIESVEVNGKMNILQNLPDRRSKTTLKADQNNLVFRYTAICFRNVEQIRYQYKLEGYDKDWVHAETFREARYTNLPPGHYTFRVMVSPGGSRKDFEQHFSFTIKPFFWQTGWFIICSILLVSGVVFGIYSYKVRQLKKLVRVRTRIAADLHDDVSSTLSSISILSIILNKKVKDPESAVIVDEIGINAQNMLERIDDIIWLVNPLNDKFENLGLRISEFAAPLFELKNIIFTIDYPDKMVNTRITMETRRNIFLIAKEAINNILKYADCLKAEIIFRQENGCLIMDIIDDGVGFDPTVLTSRNGLKNMKQRSDKIHGMLKIDSKPGKGTQINLEVKLTNKR
ncbi:MAG: triple tyrosine motif-containing protein [Bacteroidetes bacterium]|nr:triple tyrosine motif-containing protein [Bacteroidota bacterium]